MSSSYRHKSLYSLICVYMYAYMLKNKMPNSQEWLFWEKIMGSQGEAGIERGNKLWFFVCVHYLNF